MAGCDIDFVTFHHALQYLGRACGQDPGAQLLGHGLHIADVEIEFPGDLLVRQLQTQEVKTQDPEPQRLMMAGEDGVGEVVEPRLTGQAPITLPVPLPLVMAVPRHLVAPALRALHALGPAQMPDCREASGIVDQRPDVDQAVSIAAGSFPLLTAAARGGKTAPRAHRSSQQAEAIIGAPTCRPPP